MPRQPTPTSAARRTSRRTARTRLTSERRSPASSRKPDQGEDGAWPCGSRPRRENAWIGALNRALEQEDDVDGMVSPVPSTATGRSGRMPSRAFSAQGLAT